jgi:hypothetical protein
VESSAIPKTLGLVQTKRFAPSEKQSHSPRFSGSAHFSPTPGFSESGIFTHSKTLEEVAGDDGESGVETPGGQSLGVILGAVFGVLAVVGIVLGLWCMLSRDRSEEEPDEAELGAETQLTEESFSVQAGEECASGYQSHDLEGLVATTQVYGIAFTHQCDEGEMLV